MKRDAFSGVAACALAPPTSQAPTAGPRTRRYPDLGGGSSLSRMGIQQRAAGGSAAGPRRESEDGRGWRRIARGRGHLFLLSFLGGFVSCFCFLFVFVFVFVI
ncbi:hypothetical protein K505DRAFT_98405 [Melanomma pulvis-pyrius CBS 109.77]|uniref:Uncharacterized protein n=1 Tax=Melanomma pulvis-pyrius CBS 109.77 TaxID=1314802 RepID=A0A6A6WYW7_9PLEO|nr:hypothetical protein K505DRAFT_98405 [Melanomma pulvis-pyrius CBS 109.77]